MAALGRPSPMRGLPGTYEGQVDLGAPWGPPDCPGGLFKPESFNPQDSHPGRHWADLCAGLRWREPGTSQSLGC